MLSVLRGMASGLSGTLKAVLDCCGDPGTAPVAHLSLRGLASGHGVGNWACCHDDMPGAVDRDVPKEDGGSEAASRGVLAFGAAATAASNGGKGGTGGGMLDVTFGIPLACGEC